MRLAGTMGGSMISSTKRGGIYDLDKEALWDDHFPLLRWLHLWPIAFLYLSHRASLS